MTSTNSIPAPLPAPPHADSGSDMLRGHSVLVTGASGGLGRAAACRAAKEGARAVVVHGRSAGGAEHTAELVSSLGAEAHVVLAGPKASA